MPRAVRPPDVGVDHQGRQIALGKMVAYRSQPRVKCGTGQLRLIPRDPATFHFSKSFLSVWLRDAQPFAVTTSESPKTM